MVDFASDSILALLPAIFPTENKVKLKGEFDAIDKIQKLTREIKTGLTLSTHELDQHLHLLKENLGSYYDRHGSYMYEYDEDDKVNISKPNSDARENKSKWDEFKLEEMRLSELIYVSYYHCTENTKELAYYVSFLITDEDMRDTFNTGAGAHKLQSRKLRSKQLEVCNRILYVYELQLDQRYRRMGIGYEILNTLLPQVLNAHVQNEQVERDPDALGKLGNCAKIDKTVVEYIRAVQLCCFEDNHPAIGFYEEKCKFVNLFRSKRLQNGHFYIFNKDIIP
ncbi:hypothetical protein ACO0RG_000101 [Hanseniaspora osmophila]